MHAESCICRFPGGWTLRILIIDNDAAVGRVLLNGLKSEHFSIDIVRDGEEGLLYLSEVNYDLVILDLNLPKIDGLTVLKRARARRRQMPMLVLSERATVPDRVLALETGADDIMAKPFAFNELVARVRTLLRRPPELKDVLRVADLEIDRTRHLAKRAGKPLQLTQREYALLEYMMRNAGRPVSRTMVVQNVWNAGFEGLTNIVDVYINYLRAKVDVGFEQKLIQTARGVGYVLVEPEQDTMTQSC